MLKLGSKKPQQSRSKHTVEAIFGAVTHILNKDGVNHLTTNKIAEVAGVSVGSLYQYFKNKESIYEGILLKITQDNLNTFEENLRAATTSTPSIREIITITIQNHFETMQKMERVATVLLEYAPKILPPSHFKKADERIISFLIRIVDEFKIPIRPENKEQAFFICSQAVRSVMLMSFLNREAQERQLIMNELIDMISVYLEPIKR